MKLLAIIGCAKSGTTALARHLGKRPDMVLGTHKEPRHFTDFADRKWTGPGAGKFENTLVSNPAAYRANFEGLTPEQWAIDSSTDYLWCAAAPERLKAFGAENTVRLICITRDPVDRAVSEYNHTLRRNWEKLSLVQALDAEAKRMAAGWQPLFYHRRRSTICADIHKYHDLMGERLLMVDHAELMDPKPLFQRISDFLDVPQEDAHQIEKENQTRLPRNSLAKAALKNPKLRKASKWLLPEGLRDQVRNNLRTDARNLSTVKPEEIERLHRDLSEEIERCVASPLIKTDFWQNVLKA